MKKGLTFPLHLTIILIVRWSTRLTNELNGGIAQLGERLNGIQEVSGSIPLISTKKACFLTKTSLFHNFSDVFDISPLFCAPSGCTHFSHTPRKN